MKTAVLVECDLLEKMIEVAAYGLFNICKTMVIADNGKPRPVFEFARPKGEQS